jgi:stearoyl-CoA desaturase (delta-9 desaturase)
MIQNTFQEIKPIIFWWAGIFSLFWCIVYVIITGEWWWFVSAFIAQRVISPMANGVANHRYFSHRSFKTGPLRHKFLLWVSILGASGSPISYSMIHRHHHKFSDQKLDIHSPKNSLLDALGFFTVRKYSWFVKNKQLVNFPKDLIKMTDVRFVHQNYYNIWLILFAFSLLVSWKFLFLFTLPLIGLFILSSGLYINVLSHLKLPNSYRTYNTTDNSYNNKWMHLYTLQEGLHNNHHKFPQKYNQAFNKGEFDFSGWMIEKFFDIEYKKSPATQ